MTEELKQEIFACIAEGELRDAIEKLQAALTIDDLPYLDIALLSGRLKNLEKKEKADTISNQKATQQRNDISENLFRIVKRIEVHQARPEVTPPLSRHQSSAQSSPSPLPTSSSGYIGEIRYSGSIMAKRREMTLRLPYGIAFQKCLDMMPKAKIKVTSIDKRNGILQGKVKGHLLTAPLGEKVLVWLTETGVNSTTIVLISDCALPITLVDYGRNNANLDRLMAIL